MPSDLETEKLKQSLMQDLASAQASQEQSQVSRGMPVSPDENFMPRAIRTKNKVIADVELNNLKSEIDKTVKELGSTAGFVNDLDRATWENSLRKRLNQAGLAALNQSLAFRKQLQETEMDAEKQRQIWKAAGNAIAVGTAAAVSRYPTQKGGGLSTTTVQSQPSYGQPVTQEPAFGPQPAPAGYGQSPYAPDSTQYPAFEPT